MGPKKTRASTDIIIRSMVEVIKALEMALNTQVRVEKIVLISSSAFEAEQYSVGRREWILSWEPMEFGEKQRTRNSRKEG